MKKAKQKKQRQESSSGIKITTWVATLLSVGILYAAVKIFVGDMQSFRSCSADNTGLVLVNCGKQSFASGDYILLGFLIGSLILFAALSYATVQTFRSNK